MVSLVDRRRYARTGTGRGAFIARERRGKLPPIYRAGKGRVGQKGLYASDHAEPESGGRFRWLISTCVAAAVGAVGLMVVIFGATDQTGVEDGLMPSLQRMRDNVIAAPAEPTMKRTEGLKWAVPRTDRLNIASGAASTRYIIHETLRQKRGGREYIYAKPYVRITTRLAPVPPNYADVIPPFNPFTLYANAKPIGAGEDGGGQVNATRDVLVRVVELLGGILPSDDGQEIDNQEAAELVTRADLSGVSGAQPSPDDAPLAAADIPLGQAGDKDKAVPPNTTVLAKASDTEAATNELDGLKRVVKTVGEGEKLNGILTAAGAPSWQIREMFEAMKSVFPEKSLTAGQQVHIVLAPSLTQQNQLEPIRFSIFDDGQVHRVTVSRNDAGEFVASAVPGDDERATRFALTAGDLSQPSSLYASLYHASLMQSVPSETIMQVLRIHAYETDFRRRLRSDDSAELFFDLKDEGGTEGPPGELLFTAIASAGEIRKFYRFRTPDGQVDYYDAQGNNSKRFLIRRPVRGEDVRLTSGFGVRFHPLLNERRMHTGVDWSTAPGTPILAAGNGTIEEAGRKGHYGNYVRIRHGNGYQSAYGHMQKLAEGAAPGVKVRQGQVIGYVGSTGLSSGPHLHYEVLVNNQFVDPLSLQVPRERQLTAGDLAAFQKERNRIDDLMRRTPVLKASK